MQTLTFLDGVLVGAGAVALTLLLDAWWQHCRRRRAVRQATVPAYAVAKPDINLTVSYIPTISAGVKERALKLGDEELERLERKRLARENERQRESEKE